MGRATILPSELAFGSAFCCLHGGDEVMSLLTSLILPGARLPGSQGEQLDPVDEQPRAPIVDQPDLDLRGGIYCSERHGDF